VNSKKAAARSQRPRARGQKPTYEAQVNAIVAERERKMAEIGSLRRPDHAPGSFVDKAETLLTSGWSKATWHSRENILRTVDWLLHMERVQRGVRAGPLGETV
jgi:hypothetical protein